MELTRREEGKVRVGESRRWTRRSNGDALNWDLEGASVEEDGGCRSLSMVSSSLFVR